MELLFAIGRSEIRTITGQAQGDEGEDELRNAQRKNYVETHFWMVFIVCVCVCVYKVPIGGCCSCIVQVLACVLEWLIRVAETVIFYSRSKGLLV